MHTSRGRYGLLVPGYITKTIWVHRAFWQCTTSDMKVKASGRTDSIVICLCYVWKLLSSSVYFLFEQSFIQNVDVWKCVAELQVTGNKTKQNLTGHQASPPEPVLQVAMTSITCTHKHTRHSNCAYLWSAKTFRYVTIISSCYLGINRRSCNVKTLLPHRTTFSVRFCSSLFSGVTAVLSVTAQTPPKKENWFDQVEQLSVWTSGDQTETPQLL